LERMFGSFLNMWENRPVFQENNHTTKQKLCMAHCYTFVFYMKGLTDRRTITSQPISWRDHQISLIMVLHRSIYISLTFIKAFEKFKWNLSIQVTKLPGLPEWAFQVNVIFYWNDRTNFNIVISSFSPRRQTYLHLILTSSSAVFSKTWEKKMPATTSWTRSPVFKRASSATLLSKNYPLTSSKMMLSPLQGASWLPRERA